MPGPAFSKPDKILQALKSSYKIFIGSLIAIILLSSAASAQRRKVFNLPKYDQQKFHFGFTLGLNQMNFTIKTQPDINTRMFSSVEVPNLNVDSAMLLGVNSNPTIGFIVGIIGEMRLGRYFGLRFSPSLSFGERSANFSMWGYRGGVGNRIDVTKRISSTFVDFPLVFKYNSKRLNNMRAYLLTGAQYSLDLAATAKKKDENQEISAKLKSNDVYFIVGTGFDFFNPWFKFGIEVKMCFGILDILKREGTIYNEGIESVHSKILQVNFTFE